MKEARIEDKKMAWLVQFFNNQANTLSTKYHDEKSANMTLMASNLIQAIWLMDNEQFETMYKEGL